MSPESANPISGVLPLLKQSMLRVAQKSAPLEHIAARMSSLAQADGIDFLNNTSSRLCANTLRKWLDPSDTQNNPCLVGVLAFCKATGDPAPLAALLPSEPEASTAFSPTCSPPDMSGSNTPTLDDSMHTGAQEESEQRISALIDQLNAIEQENRQLREQDCLKTSLLASLSHELRTPLTSIMGFAKVTSRSFDRYFGQFAVDNWLLQQQTNVIENNLGIILREGERLTRMVNNILDISKIESGDFQYHDAMIDVSSTLEHAVEAASGDFLKNKRLSLITKISHRLPRIHADKDKLEQVVINLLHNAAKFTFKGVVTLTADSDDRNIVIKVKDTGIGIPENIQERIFEKYCSFQPETDYLDPQSGTGLGLALCRQIITHYRGDISVISKPQYGSTFIVTLPIGRG